MITKQKIYELANEHNYLADIPFLFEQNIWEYDIKQANISALRAFNRIDEDNYHRLSLVPKMQREIEIGKMIRDDKSIGDIIKPNKMDKIIGRNITYDFSKDMNIVS